jgi:flagellar L-ring protein precursor FlgH
MSKKIMIPTLLALLLTSPVFAQSGAINGTPTLLTPSGRPMRMTDASLTFQTPPRQRMFDIGDIIYVHIKDIKTYSNTANNQRKKKISSEASLTAWSKVTGLFKMPVPMTDSLPEIGGTIDHNTQNQGRLTRNQTIDFYIPCSITDIRDNGNLVIEGNRVSGIGEEGSTTTVNGIVRPDTIGADFRVESNQVAELVIREVPSGNVYDTVRRPWGTRLMEQLKPF